MPMDALSSPPPTVRTGLERLLAEELPRLRGRRVALLINPTAVTARLQHAADLLAAAPGVTLVRLFGPEHGIRGDAQDMIAVPGAGDPETGVEVVSLYGAHEDSLSPPPGSLDDVDVLIYDVQDIGTRFYTFAATLARCMDAAAAAGVEVLVCDRPNPIGGVLTEGAWPIAPGYESFVGHFPVAVRHGLTVGELARWHQRTRCPDVALEVLPLEGWRREHHYGDTGLPWVLPSPNMPTVDTALVYPGMCLVEGTNLSEGRGTTRPFELVGAPWLSGPALARELERAGLAGVRFRAGGFTPTFQKHAGRPCGGVQLHVTDPRTFRPVACALAVLVAARKLAPADFAWRAEAYEFVRDKPAIDLLAGSPWLREAIDAGATLPELLQPWREDEHRYQEERRGFLLYA